MTNEVVTSSLLNTHVRDNLKAIPHPYHSSVATVDVTNTVSETSLYSATITGNDLGSNGFLTVTLMGDYLYNNSASDTVRLRFKFGGTTHMNDTVAFASSDLANLRRPWKIVYTIWNAGAANSQWMSAELGYSGLEVGGAGTPSNPSAGIGQFGVGGFSMLGISSAAAIDTTAAQTVEITAQWSAASANDSLRRRVANTFLANG